MKSSLSILKWVKMGAFSACICLAGNIVRGQETKIDMEHPMDTPKPPETKESKLLMAQKFAANKQYDSAVITYSDLYKSAPDDIYPEYLATLIIAKKYKEAEKLVQARMTQPNTNGNVYEIDLGRIYKLQGKEDKATELFNSAVMKVNGDDMLTQRIAKAFTDAELYEYAIRVYDRGSGLVGNRSFYCIQTANLFAKTNQLDKAMDEMLTGSATQFSTPDNLKAMFLQWMGDDPKKLQIGQKNLLKRLTEQPDNVYFAELLTWIYTQKNDWDGALMQMEAIDERNQETGKRLLDFARLAINAKQYEAAGKAYDDVIAKGATNTLYGIAKSEKVSARFTQLKNAPEVKAEDVTTLLKQYDELLTEFPQYYSTQTASDYATVSAQFADSVDKGIHILQKALKSPTTTRQFTGVFKLQLGDYYLLKGKIWEASLSYSQVDKEFKQDIMGEDARFRNAKLAYYRGDFEYAQHLLGVLKASTTELIANDALLLSVQITENVEDSFTYPLTRFAYAGLLFSQNKDSVAGLLIDSIAKAFPKHPLNDDIIMAHAKTALKHHDYDKALSFLHDIIQKYGQDVLGDDALFMTAEIYRINLHKNDEAKKNYEQLIIDFPGSTFVQAARQHIRDINNGVLP